MPEIKQEVKSKSFVATADFEIEKNFKVVLIKQGDTFAIPEGWERDNEFEEFRKIDRKGARGGIAFRVPYPVLDERGKPKYIDSRRVILPLKEV